jgi:3-oxoacyl-[acyl-carrier protein] reductase
MSTQVDSKLYGQVLQDVRKAADASLKMQQEMLGNWSRFWPGLSGIQATALNPIQKAQSSWTDSMFDLARNQWSLLDRQFDVAVESLESVFGIAGKPSEPPIKKEQVSIRETNTEAEMTPTPQAPDLKELNAMTLKELDHMTSVRAQNIAQKVAVVTGAASGIGSAVSLELANRGALAVMMVDVSEHVNETADSINQSVGRDVAVAMIGDTTDAAFRSQVYDDARENHGVVSICVPAAGITRDALTVRMNKETGKASVYSIDDFRSVTEVNLIAPIYWAMEMVAKIAEDRLDRGLKRWEPEEGTEGAVIFLGSVSSQGNKGQISYAVAKAGLEGAAATLMKEAIFHGVRCGIIHPGFTDTPMAQKLGDEFLQKYVLPYTQLRRLIRPEEIADAICFMISNAAVSGELWADAGWHPPA